MGEDEGGSVGEGTTLSIIERIIETRVKMKEGMEVKFK